MAKILSIDTSTNACSVAVMVDEKIVGEIYTDFDLKHSEKLLLIIKDLLKNIRMGITDIDKFIIGSGPGSFTGLRIGASTVKSFAHALNKEIIPISSLYITAYNFCSHEIPICVMFDAQRGQVYANIFIKKDGKIIPVYKDSTLDLNEIFLMCKYYDKIIFAGDAVSKYENEINNALKSRAYIAKWDELMPKASSALKLYADMENNILSVKYDMYLPNYLRASAAEEKSK